MSRQSFKARDGGNVRWFNPGKAIKYDENFYWDGQNLRSRATGAIWTHEILYRSADGYWILRKWSQMDGSTDEWREISPADAAQWLVKNKYEELPHELRPYAADL